MEFSSFFLCPGCVRFLDISLPATRLVVSLGRNGHRRPPVELSFYARRSLDCFLGSCTLPYSETATIDRSHQYSGGCIARSDCTLDAPPPQPPLSFLASRASICLAICAGILDQPSDEILEGGSGTLSPKCAALRDRILQTAKRVRTGFLSFDYRGVSFMNAHRSMFREFRWLTWDLVFDDQPGVRKLDLLLRAQPVA